MGIERVRQVCPSASRVCPFRQSISELLRNVDVFDCDNQIRAHFVHA